MPAGITGGFALTDNESVKKYAKDITVATMQDSKWLPFMGANDNSIIKTKKEIGVKEGGNVKMRFRALVRGAGITGDTDFEGNEDVMPYLYQSVDMELVGNALKSPGRLSDQSDALDFRSDAKSGLSDWGADKMDRIIYTRLSDSSTNICISGHYTVNTKATLTTSDTFSTADIDEMMTRAKKGVDHAGTAVPRLRPVKTMMYDGKIIRLKQPMFLLKIGSKSAQDLRSDTSWEGAHQSAGVRGDSNAIFTGQLGVWNGVIVVEDGTQTTEYAGIIPAADGGSGANLAYEKNLFLGATSALMPMDGMFKYWEENIDAGRKLRIAIDRVFGFQKTKWTASTGNTDGVGTVYHNKDYGVIVNYAYAG